jgi:hypothetical protein
LHFVFFSKYLTGGLGKKSCKRSQVNKRFALKELGDKANCCRAAAPTSDYLHIPLQCALFSSRLTRERKLIQQIMKMQKAKSALAPHMRLMRRK